MRLTQSILTAADSSVGLRFGLLKLIIGVSHG